MGKEENLGKELRIIASRKNPNLVKGKKKPYKTDLEEYLEDENREPNIAMDIIKKIVEKSKEDAKNGYTSHFQRVEYYEYFKRKYVHSDTGWPAEVADTYARENIIPKLKEIFGKYRVILKKHHTGGSCSSQRGSDDPDFSSGSGDSDGHYYQSFEIYW